MKSPNLFLQFHPDTKGYPEVPAQFPGGIQVMSQFIRQHLEYPMLALEDGVEGTVLVSFTVNENGSIQAPKIMKSLDVDCDEAVLHLLSQMPKWIPAQNLGASVPVQVQLPIEFQLALVPSEYE